MNRYKALIRYEFKTLRWMVLYFAIVCLGIFGLFAEQMKSRRSSFITHTEIWQIQNLFTQEMNGVYGIFLIGSVVGLVLLVYLQFRDAKNIEVGRFLKALPLQGSQLYVIRMGCGIVTYTVPFLVYSIGMLYLRSYHGDWLQDYYSISMLQTPIEAAESFGSIILLLGILYLVITAAYVALLMMQYLISNRIFAIIVTAIMFFVPFYIAAIVGEFIRVEQFLTIPLAYGYMDTSLFESGLRGEMAQVCSINLMGAKVLILLIIIVVSVAVGWIRSKQFKVEDQSKLIPEKFSRIIFVGVGTVCVALLPCYYTLVMIGSFALDRGMASGSVWISMFVAGLIGYIVMYKIARIGCKEK
ncbi:MAG: hypothetical protein RR090_03815 [Niameybacter sp.]|uniref:hypothetical protein n=1 Tax=Niameybacter sp. TaxID=2033640 RepID=UPI002FC90979